MGGVRFRTHAMHNIWCTSCSHVSSSGSPARGLQRRLTLWFGLVLGHYCDAGLACAGIPELMPAAFEKPDVAGESAWQQNRCTHVEHASTPTCLMVAWDGDLFYASMRGGSRAGVRHACRVRMSVPRAL